MKKTDIKDLHTKTIDELKEMYKAAKSEIIDLNIEKSQFKLKNPRSIFNKKKDIARILTILRGKELSDEKSNWRISSVS